jgi:GNAT superfamily N-acetyltransferase
MDCYQWLMACALHVESHTLQIEALKADPGYADKKPVSAPIQVRPITEVDYAAWKPLWNGYNAFYGRKDESALADEITQSTWQRFFDPAEPVFAMVAEREGQIVGLVHYLFHRSTIFIGPTCYLQDLFTLPTERGRGAGRALIEAVCQQAKDAGAKRVYWHTQDSNAAGRMLYDKVAQHRGFIVYTRDL